jgi:hypothetical protein
VDGSIEGLAAEWLFRERVAVARDNDGATEAAARAASEAYDGAIRGATLEELLLAWRAAVKSQEAQEIGSVQWLEARSVSELLRTEYEAARSI